jgi:hypothetical protein
MSDDTSLYIHTLVGMRFDVAKTPMTREYQAQIEEYEKALCQKSERSINVLNWLDSGSENRNTR